MTPRKAQKLVTTGADPLIAHSAQTSKGDPRLAIAQLLFAAVAIAKADGMSLDDLNKGINAALSFVLVSARNL